MLWIELIGGLALLLGGGEALVRGSVSLARRLGVSQLMIGLTPVGFGTSTPELVSSIQAVLRGAPGIAVGNVVGSNIANVLLILGLSALILPIATSRAAFKRDGPALLGASVLVVAVVLAGEMSAWMGVCFLMLLVGYLVYTYFQERSSDSASAQMHSGIAAPDRPANLPIWAGLLLALGGIAAVVYGADLLVGAAIVLARQLDMSEAVIGLTLVAVGTSLPELVTSVTAALRGRGDLAFGNIVGSNIFNALGILGSTALVAPIVVPAQIGRFDVWVMLGAAMLLVVFATTGWRLGRREGGVFLVLFCLYLATQFSPDLRQMLGLS